MCQHIKFITTIFLIDHFQAMQVANSDFASFSVLNTPNNHCLLPAFVGIGMTVYNHCLPPASAGNGQLRIWSIELPLSTVFQAIVVQTRQKSIWQKLSSVLKLYPYYTFQPSSWCGWQTVIIHSGNWPFPADAGAANGDYIRCSKPKVRQNHYELSL